jgi:hypothetical protein
MSLRSDEKESPKAPEVEVSDVTSNRSDDEYLLFLGYKSEFRRDYSFLGRE